jgi:hypothetical protein
MGAPDIISIVTVDVDKAIEREFNRWYDERHVGEVLACPGWLWGARYVSTDGEPRYLAMYEMANEEAMWTPELQAIKGFGPFWKSVESYHSRIYRKIHYATRDEATDARGEGL